MKKYLIIIFTALFASCSYQKTPDYVIPEDEMVDIIVDIHLLDGIMSIKSIQQELLEADTSNYYDLIFEKYGYIRADFDTSLFYYSKNINTYDKIYDEVLNRLASMEADVEEEIRKEQEVDTLRNVSK